MEDKDAIISTLHSLNLTLVKELDKLQDEFFVMEEYQTQIADWITYFDDMEEKLTLCNEHILVDLREK
jgi:hypothetical protein